MLTTAAGEVCVKETGNKLDHVDKNNKTRVIKLRSDAFCLKWLLLKPTKINDCLFFSVVLDTTFIALSQFWSRWIKVTKEKQCCMYSALSWPDTGFHENKQHLIGSFIRAVSKGVGKGWEMVHAQMPLYCESL